MQVFELARQRFTPAAEAWIDRLATIDFAEFEVFFSLMPQLIMSETAREFGLCLLQLNRNGLVSRTFRYA